MMKLGFGKSCLTPKLGVELTGFGWFLNRKAESVETNLFARATAWDVDGFRFVLVICDLLGFTEEMSDKIVSGIAENNNISKENVLLAATHTHSGPGMGCLVGCGEPDFETLANLPGKIIAAADEAFANLATVTSISINEDEFPFTFAYNRIKNDDTSIDPTIRTMRVEREGAKPVAIVNHSCHPVCLRATPAISADFPYYFCDHLENAGFDAMYINGFCGNIDPYYTGHYGAAQHAGKLLFDRTMELFDADKKMDETDVAVVGGLESIALRHITLDQMEADVKQAVANKDWSQTRALSICYDRASLRLMYEDDPYTEQMEFRALRLGKVLFVFHGGEICSAFGDMIRDAFPDYTVFLAGTAYATKRYVATEKNADEAEQFMVYEIISSCYAYGCFPIERGAGEVHFKAVIDRIKPIV